MPAKAISCSAVAVLISSRSGTSVGGRGGGWLKMRWRREGSPPAPAAGRHSGVCVGRSSSALLPHHELTGHVSKALRNLAGQFVWPVLQTSLSTSGLRDRTVRRACNSPHLSDTRWQMYCSISSRDSSSITSVSTPYSSPRTHRTTPAAT